MILRTDATRDGSDNTANLTRDRTNEKSKVKDRSCW